MAAAATAAAAAAAAAAMSYGHKMFNPAIVQFHFK
jgi:hypothetical protein